MLLKLCVVIVVVMSIKVLYQFIKEGFHCQVYNMETKPDFEEWLIHQDYDNMLYGYKDLLEYILTATSKKS